MNISTLSMKRTELRSLSLSKGRSKRHSKGQKLLTLNFSLLTVFAVLLCLLLGGKAWGQSLSDYTFSYDVTTFNSIVNTSGSTQMSFSTTDDGYATCTFPFAFIYGGSSFDSGASIACSANGFIYLGATSTSGTTGSYSGTTYRAINAIMQQDAHLGRYTDAGAWYKHDASAGTFTIEYHKLGAYAAVSNTYGIYSYQVVFHSNGKIEFIYDEVDHQSATSRTMATYLTDGPNSDFVYVTGAWASPTTSSSYVTRPFSPVPTHGLRYTFTPSFTITCHDFQDCTANSSTSLSPNSGTTPSGYLPDDWKGYGSSYFPFVASHSSYMASGYSGGNFLYFKSASSNACFLALPYNGVSSVSFNYAFESDSYGTLEIGYMTDISSSTWYNNTFYNKKTCTNNGTTWGSGTVSFSDVSDATYYVVFKFTNTSSTWYSAAIDNVCVVVVGPACEDPELSYSPASHTITYGGSYTRPTFNNPHSVTPLTATSSNTSVATVNSSGVVTLGSAAGTTTITVNFAGDDTYCEGSATYTLTVNKANLTSPTLTVTPKVMRNTLSWSSAGTGTASYQILRGTTSGSLSAYTTVTSSTTTYNDDGVTAGTPYYYQVRAVPDANHNEAISTEKSGTPIGCSAELAVSPAACKGESITLNANVCTGAGTTITWKDGSTSLGTTTAGNDDGTVVSSTKNASFSTAGAHNLQITLNGGRCTNTASASVKVVNAPSATSPRDEVNICGTGTATLSLPESEIQYKDCSGLSYKWSTGATSTSITVSSSDTYTLTVTKSLYKKNDYIKIGNKEGIVVTPPTATTAGKAVALTDAIANDCSGSAISTDADVRFAMVVNGGTEAASRKGFDIPAGAAGGVCASTGIEFPVNISPYPDAPTANPSNTNYCGAGPHTGTFTVTAPSGCTIEWYTASTGGTHLGSGASYTKTGLTTTTTYYAEARNAAGCASSMRTAVTCTINPVPAAPSSPSTNAYCGTSNAVFSASAPSGCTIDWYAAASGGSSIASGASYTHNDLGTTTTYYAESRNTTTGCVSATRTAVTCTIETSSVSITSVSATPSNLCVGKPATLSVSATGTGTISYEWSSGAAGASTIVTPTETTTYTVVVTATTTGVGCTATASTTLTVSVETPDIAGISDGDMVWSGNAGTTNWATAGNWLTYGGSDYSVAASAPSASTNVFLATYGECVTNNPALTAEAATRNLTIGSGRSLDIDEYTLSVAGNLTNSGTFTAGTGTVVFNGSTHQTISGSSLTLNNVTFNNDKNFTFSGLTPTVSGTATFTAGIVTGDMNFGASATTADASRTSHVDGKVTKAAGSSSFTFPTGNAGVLGSVTATVTSDGTWVRFHNLVASGDALPADYPRFWNPNDNCDNNDPQFDHVSNFEYWDISSPAVLSNATIVASADNASKHFGSTDPAPTAEDVLGAIWTGSCWKNLGGSNQDISDENRTIRVEGVVIPAVTRAGTPYFTLGSKTHETLLPIELVSFTADCDGRSSLVEWTTATEKNNDYFSLERSDDAVNFTEIARVAGAGNSIEPIDYSYTDYGIHGGDNYYRLVQVDYDGTRTVSEIVVANCIEPEVGEPDVQAYPNPFSSDLTVVLDNFGNRAATIEVYDMLGKLIYTNKVAAPQNSYETILNLSNLPPAAYTVRVSTNDFVINRNVVKQ